MYAGKGTWLERDEAARRVVIEANGKDKRGNGTAGAVITAHLREDGEGTRVVVHTDLKITGRPAQFGRSVIQDVGSKILDKFASCLSTRLGGGELGAGGQAAPAAAAAAAAAGGAGGPDGSATGPMAGVVPGPTVVDADGPAAGPSAEPATEPREAPRPAAGAAAGSGALDRRAGVTCRAHPPAAGRAGRRRAGPGPRHGPGPAAPVRPARRRVRGHRGDHLGDRPAPLRRVALTRSRPAGPPGPASRPGSAAQAGELAGQVDPGRLLPLVPRVGGAVDRLPQRERAQDGGAPGPVGVQRHERVLLTHLGAVGVEALLRCRQDPQVGVVERRGQGVIGRRRAGSVTARGPRRRGSPPRTDPAVAAR